MASLNDEIDGNCVSLDVRSVIVEDSICRDKVRYQIDQHLTMDPNDSTLQAKTRGGARIVS